LSPELRYRRAVQLKLAGDAQAYYDALFELAAQAPQSRAGRRARATLRGSDILTDLTVLSAAGSVVFPNFTSAAVQPPESEAQQGLRTIALMQRNYFNQHNRYCPSFTTCGLTPPPESKYLYFLTPTEVAGGEDNGSSWGSDLPSRVVAATAALKRAGVTPKSTKDSFLAAAVGNADSDATLDIWTIDANDQLATAQEYRDLIVAYSSEGVGGQTVSALNDLNPDDIERIEVVKGPAAATL